MKSDLLTSMLKACAHASGKKGEYSLSEDVSFSVLIESGAGGAAPVPKVKSIKLEADFVHISTDESNYMFGYESVVGIKWSDRGGSRTNRTGFHA